MSRYASPIADSTGGPSNFSREALLSPAPFLSRRSPIDGDVHLLPTASVVMVVDRAGEITFVMPHRTVRLFREVAECAALTPNFIKCLLGEPRRHLGQEWVAGSHPMLAPFVGCGGIDGAMALLRDLRESLAVTPDEQAFLALWASPEATAGAIPTGDRWVQRLCLRFAGQSPQVLNTTTALARTLESDDQTGLYNGLGAFADASHFGRVCKDWTGRTPKAWRHLSRPFY